MQQRVPRVLHPSSSHIPSSYTTPLPPLLCCLWQLAKYDVRTPLGIQFPWIALIYFVMPYSLLTNPLPLPLPLLTIPLSSLQMFWNPLRVQGATLIHRLLVMTVLLALVSEIERERGVVRKAEKERVVSSNYYNNLVKKGFSSLRASLCTTLAKFLSSCHFHCLSRTILLMLTLVRLASLSLYIVLLYYIYYNEDLSLRSSSVYIFLFNSLLFLRFLP